MEEHDKPRMVVLAGPNGSGKSTVTDGLRKDPSFPGNYINADVIATTLTDIEDANKRNFVAANQAESQRRDAVNGDKPFAFETVMSTPAKMGLFDEARKNGFQVDMVFVTTEDPSINVGRVSGRVMKGGHDVPEDKIRERYGRAMDLLPAALQKADNAEVYDNSVHGVPAVLVAQKKNGEITFPPLVQPKGMEDTDFERLQKWRAEKIEGPIVAHEASRRSLTAEVGKMEGATVAHADVTNGTRYTGRIVGVTDQHVLQHVEGTKQFVLHDRALTPPGMDFAQAMKVGEPVTTAYDFGPDGKHRAPEVKAQAQVPTQTQTDGQAQGGQTDPPGGMKFQSKL